MFLSSSRYANLTQVQTTALPGGATVTAVKLRRLPAVTGDPTPMKDNDRLDIIAGQEYGDASMFWHIADANTALYSPNLLKPWLSGDPQAGQITIIVPEQ
jgi:hypothetical protein